MKTTDALSSLGVNDSKEDTSEDNKSKDGLEEMEGQSMEEELAQTVPLENSATASQEEIRSSSNQGTTNIAKEEKKLEETAEATSAESIAVVIDNNPDQESKDDNILNQDENVTGDSSISDQEQEPPQLALAQQESPTTPSSARNLVEQIENALLLSKEEDKKSSNDLLGFIEDDESNNAQELTTETQPLTHAADDFSSDAHSDPPQEIISTIEDSSCTEECESIGLSEEVSTLGISISAAASSIQPSENDSTEEEAQLMDTVSQDSVALSLPDMGTSPTTDSQEILTSNDFIVPPRSPSSEAIHNTATTTTDWSSAADFHEGVGEEEWNEGLNVVDVVEEGALKAEPPTENLEDALPSADNSDNNTIVTEAAGTDTTSDTEDSISTTSKPIYQIDDDDDDILLRDQGGSDDDLSMQQHSLMPRQPEILVAAVGLDAAPVEEEKTEVDGYPMEEIQEKIVDVEDILALPEPPIVEPTPLLPRVVDFDDNAHHSVPPVIENKRAEYVSVTVLKMEANWEHGLEFIMVGKKLRLSRISPTGLFAGSPLAPFDKMLRINDLNIETLDPVNASHLLDVLTGAITVIAQNQGGVSDLVESQITKPLPHSNTGIDFQNGCTDEEIHKNQLEIVRIGTKSLFSAALLHVGDKLLSINGCSDLDQNIGDLLLSTAPKHCVVLARTRLKTQMAIARRPTHQLPPGFNFVRAMEEARRQREELRRKQGCYYNSCERPGACANILQWLGNVYVITIVIVGISISWQSIKEETIDGSDAVATILKFAGLFVGGILLGFVVNAPWWFRKVGARFSIAQLVCNIIVIASYFILTQGVDSDDLVAEDYRLAIFFSLFFPLLIIVNLPSVFVKREDGSDGNTISDRSPSDDEMSTDSDATDIV